MQNPFHTPFTHKHLIPLFMLRLTIFALLANIVLGGIDHYEFPKEEVLEQLQTEFGSGRKLAQSWAQFNNYFSGISGQPSPLNLPTYYGQIPGPCPLASAGHTTKCFARACKMDPTIQAIVICADPLAWLLGCKPISDWINCGDCTNYPGNLWLYNVDAGNFALGGLYLDLVAQDDTDAQPPQGKTFTTGMPYDSENKYYNEFRMVFTLNQLQFDSK